MTAYRIYPTVHPITRRTARHLMEAQMFQVVRKNRFTGETFVLGTFATIQDANDLKLRTNASPSNYGGKSRGSSEMYRVVQVA